MYRTCCGTADTVPHKLTCPRRQDAQLRMPLGQVSPKQVEQLRAIGCTCDVNSVVHAPGCPVREQRTDSAAELIDQLATTAMGEPGTVSPSARLSTAVANLDALRTLIEGGVGVAGATVSPKALDGALKHTVDAINALRDYADAVAIRGHDGTPTAYPGWSDL